MTANQYSEEARRRMTILAPFLDEIILAMDEVSPDGFKVDDAVAEVTAIFEDKEQNAAVVLGRFEWAAAVRGRLLANNFDLIRRESGEMTWGRKEVLSG